eukprot:TRINITY_DN3098_c0_g1_i1.p1 TRINITY_DN3098_c0_g1~~TRINITY_DN3098_c0_g1_i1.p1  ORF type:complete len:339 (-),score=52.59 TRINITY_DN3098_c0_g1_i1:17-1009(-)
MLGLVLVLISAVLWFYGGTKYHSQSPEWNSTRSTYNFAIVSDLDKGSKNSQELRWNAHWKDGTIRRLPSGNYELSWGKERILSSQIAKANRGMELSELVWFSNNLYTMCDSSGVVYEINVETGDLYPRWILSDGNGKQSKPMKIEWATVKDNKMYIGSTGKEWVENGEIKHHNMEWIKIIDSQGNVQNVNWMDNYDKLRKFVNATYPGYLWHEAITWNPNTQSWIILPRKHSVSTAYDPTADELLSTNILIIADQDFQELQLKHVAKLEPDWGYSSLKIIPDSNDLIAIKVREVDGSSSSRIEIMNAEGVHLMEPVFIDHLKYEGIEFLL